MPIIIKETTGPQVPVGTHIAVCYRIVDLGTQPDSGFGEKQKVVIFWELPHERIVVEGKERPMGMSRFYTKTLSKRGNLRKDLVAWRGREFTKEELEGFELRNILGKPCQLSVVANEQGKSQVDAVVAVPKGMAVPPPLNPIMEYSIEEGKNAGYKLLPGWVQEMCDQCLEWNQDKAHEEPAQTPSDTEAMSAAESDVPFVWVAWACLPAFGWMIG